MNELVPAAVLGPAAAALAYLLPVRAVRRVVAGLLGTAAAVAAGAVFWSAYRGDVLLWRGLVAELVPATLLVASHAAALLAGLRAATLGGREERFAVVAVGVAASAVAFAALTTAASALALFVPISTLAVHAAAVGAGPAGLRARGLIGLAGADVLVVLGLSVLVGRADSTLLAPGDGLDLGRWLLLVGAALKMGAVPGVAGWAAGGATSGAALAQVVVRAQGVVLAVVAALPGAEAGGDAALISVAAVLVLVSGLSALVRPALAGVAGIAGAIALLALGLGGAVGARAFLLLAPVLPMAWGALWLVFTRTPAVAAEPSGELDEPSSRTVWWAVAAVGGGLVLATLLLLPPAGGFPGAWLATALAASRAAVEPALVLAVVAVAAGVAAGIRGAVASVRFARPSPLGLAALAVGLASLYAGTVSARLSVGWLVRAERSLGLPTLLPSAGAPTVPPFPAPELGVAVLPAAVLALAVAARAGLRVAGPGTSPPRRRRRPSRRQRPGGWRAIPVAAGDAARAAVAAVDGLRARGYAHAVVGLLEVLALTGAARLVLLAARGGFL